MKKSLLFLLTAAILAGCTLAPPVNPLTGTDIPDNDVIRVGEDYYMVSTTMFFTPGAPIMHSKDLVHWRIVSYIFDLLEDDDVYNLRGGKNAYGSGQWATSLRYHNGMYYALFVANDQHKSYLFRTADIINGPWERFVFEDWFFHDPGLLFDGDRLYVVWGNGELHLTELESDGSAVTGNDRIIISAPKEGMGLRAEGAHFYHIGEYYYVIEIDWPEGDIRQATCWRSRSIEGPYESKVVLKGTIDGRAKDGIAQGPIVDTQNGDWYAIQFQDHGAVGRIPTLQPVTWEDGWPIMGKRGKPVKTLKVNLPEDTKGNYVYGNDGFDSTSLPLVWQWNHKAPRDWSLSKRPGWLSLKAHPSQEGIHSAIGTLTQRTVSPYCTNETTLDVSYLLPGDEAGLCAFQSNSARIGVKVKEDGSKEVVLVHGYPGGKDSRKEDTLYSAPLSGNVLQLSVRYDFKKDTASFAWKEDGDTSWTEPKWKLHMLYTLDYFTGYRSALYCFGDGGGEAFFDNFLFDLENND